MRWPHLEETPQVVCCISCPLEQDFSIPVGNSSLGVLSLYILGVLCSIPNLYSLMPAAAQIPPFMTIKKCFIGIQSQNMCTHTPHMHACMLKTVLEQSSSLQESTQRQVGKSPVMGMSMSGIGGAHVVSNTKRIPAGLIVIAKAATTV